MKNFIKKVFGLDKLEKQQEEISHKLLDTAKKLLETEQAVAKALEEERLAKLSPKEKATELQEPWVSVLSTHVNKENIRNGFFELDWNEYFIIQLKEQGYDGATEEEIVDKWFQDLCKNVASESGVNMDRRSSGHVNRALRDDGRTEVS